MNFKGTKSRTAKDIAFEFDNIGGQCNAFTSKERVCFYAKSLDTHILQGLDILCDMYLNSVYNQNDIENEKNVVYEEIAMSEDYYEEVAVERLFEEVWAEHPIGKRIIGSKDTISTFDTEKLKKYINSRISAKNTFITVSGNFDIDEITAFLEDRLGMLNNNDIRSKIDKSIYRPNFIQTEKDSEQNHICLAFDGIENKFDDKYYALSIMNTAFGNGMSSRLFQKLREEMGLVYSVYSFPVRHESGGIFCIYAALSKENQQLATEIILQEVQNMIKNGLEQDELDRARQQLKAGIILGLESTSSRMMHMGKNIMTKGQVNTPSEIIERIDKIDFDMITDVLQAIFKSKLSISAVGKNTEELKPFFGQSEFKI